MPSTNAPAKSPKQANHTHISEPGCHILREAQFPKRDFLRLRKEALIRRDAHCARTLYDACIELGLFEDGLIDFTPADLAQVMHQSEDRDLRAFGMLAIDHEADPSTRYHALIAVEKILAANQANDIDGDLVYQYRLSSALLGDSEMAAQWFEDKCSLGLLDLLVRLIVEPCGLSAPEKTDAYERFEYLIVAIGSYQEPHVFFNCSTEVCQDLAQALTNRYGLPTTEILLDLPPAEPTSAVILERISCDCYDRAVAAHFGCCEVD
ncbi:MAG: hypothetical protein WCI47_00900 [bacterium]